MLLLLLGLPGPGVQAAGPPAAPARASVEAFFDTPDMADVRLSPSGEYLALLNKAGNGRNQLVVMQLVDGQPQQARGLAHYGDADIEGLEWVDDDRLIFRLSDPEPGFDWRSWMAPGLFSVSRSGGRVRTLVRSNIESAVRVDPDFSSDRRLSHDHRLLDVPKDGSGEVLLGQIQLGPTGHIESLMPLRQHAVSGLVRPVDTGGLASARRWWFDSQGRPRAALSIERGQQTVHWRESPTGAWRKLYTAPALDAPWSPVHVDDHGVLYVAVARGPAGEAELARIDPATGAPAAQSMVKVPGFDFAGHVREAVGFSGLAGFEIEGESPIQLWFDPAHKALQDEIDARLPGRANTIDCRRCGDGERRVVLVHSRSDRDPGSWLLLTGRPGRLVMLGRVHAGIDPRQMGETGVERIQARDKRELPVWITQPRRSGETGPRPAVVMPHGGPWVRGGHWRWEPMRQYLAQRGWVVIEPEFRGSTGYGDAHFRAGWKQVGRALQDDIADATRWAIQRGLVDPKRVCLMGASHGGYAALMGLVRDPGLFRCAVAMAAVTEPLRWLEGSWWWRDDITDDGRAMLAQLLGDARADAAIFEATSPLRQVARIQAPVMLVHGERDQRVPIVHAHEMREALRRAGREPEWLVFPDEGHGWGRVANQRLLATRVADFLGRHLDGPLPPATQP
ncbi:alpha/beta hydrolase family protein [Aquabacterium sp. OR-4]|uniref:alpha/beta hydrolase family protein n=1 Tax=Aquabacterium sp. OR-4 TaxID=2978127 RepID=UPI0021B4CF40|nr:prolyl oligopeptidase family serine peptidase [Aquabacterium sp. OR-4]MDT7838363.1 prolyl oligopeptidase family serine peptidase [Aquabacterium sp. OR-4]